MDIASKLNHYVQATYRADFRYDIKPVPATIPSFVGQLSLSSRPDMVVSLTTPAPSIAKAKASLAQMFYDLYVDSVTHVSSPSVQLSHSSSAVITPRTLFDPATVARVIRCMYPANIVSISSELDRSGFSIATPFLIMLMSGLWYAGLVVPKSRHFFGDKYVYNEWDGNSASYWFLTPAGESQLSSGVTTAVDYSNAKRRMEQSVVQQVVSAPVADAKTTVGHKLEQSTLMRIESLIDYYHVFDSQGSKHETRVSQDCPIAFFSGDEVDYGSLAYYKVSGWRSVPSSNLERRWLLGRESLRGEAIQEFTTSEADHCILAIAYRGHLTDVAANYAITQLEKSLQ